MDKTTRTDRQLVRRTRSLRSQYVKRDRQVAVALDRLCEAGRVALIGGALRELHFRPPGQFESDLDFVVEVHDPVAFKQVVSLYEAKRNSFGGYGIVLDSGIRVDFWNAHETWAHVNGYRNVSHLEDIVETTFFNVDAILYILRENRLIAKEGTREALNERFLDINLLPNPNPAGAAIRAVRRLADHHMKSSTVLLEFIGEQIDKFGWSHLVNLDAKAYPQRPILHHTCKSGFWTGESFSRYVQENNGQLTSMKQYEFEFLAEEMTVADNIKDAAFSRLR